MLKNYSDEYENISIPEIYKGSLIKVIGDSAFLIRINYNSK